MRSSSLPGFRRFSSQEASELRGRASDAHIKRPEQSVNGADLVEAHLVYQFLKNQWIVSEQIYAPLPIVEANGAGDDLLYLACIAAANQPVLLHLPLALSHRKLIPVLFLSSAAIHGIEANIAVARHFRVEPRMHRLALALEDGLNFSIPFRRMRLEATLGKRFVSFGAGFIQAQLDHRQVGRRRFQVIRKLQPCEL